MKRVLSMLVMLLIAEAALAQTKNVFWSLTVKPKMDKRLEYEKKVLTFIKTHYPNLKYRCWEVITGENTGAFVFVIGPSTWKEMDAPMVSPKGEALQKTDGQALDALTESAISSYGLRQEDISNMKADRKLKYLSISSVEFEVGSWSTVHDIWVKLKDARSKSGSKADYDVFRPSMSGPTNMFSSARFLESLEELDTPGTLAESYDKIYGLNAFYKDTQTFNQIIKSQKTELRVLRTDLSQL